MSAPFRVAGTVLVLALAAVGCGVTPERSAVRTSEENVPFNLLAPDPTTTTTSSTVPRPEAPTEVATIFLVDEARLVPVTRRLPRPVDLGDQLEALTAGPTEEEAAEGLRTALPTDEQSILGVSLAGGIATVDLGGRFSSVPVDDQLLALAQIVYTVTTRPGVGRVLFTVEGAAVEVPRGDGSLTADSVARDDYATFAPA